MKVSKYEITILALAFCGFTGVLFHSCSARTLPGTDREWLARSCVGEAGWDSHETGECAALLNLYKKRGEAIGISAVEMAKRYSAAIKQHKGRPNKWVLHLRAGTDKPKKWGRGSRWEYRREDWLQTLFLVSLFEQGKVADPLPNSWGYGCIFDTPPANLRKIETNFKNIWYERKWRL